MNKQELIQLIKKNRAIIVIIFSFFLLICLPVFFDINFKAENFEERFFDQAKKRFGSKEQGKMALDIYQNFLNGYLRIKLTGIEKNKYYMQLQFPKTDQPTEHLEIRKFEKHHISLPFKPVDVQYTLTLISGKEDDLYLTIDLNEEFTRIPLKEYMPPLVKPKSIFSGSNILSIISYIITTIFLGIVGNIFAYPLIKSWEKRKKHLKKNSPKNKKNKRRLT